MKYLIVVFTLLFSGNCFSQDLDPVKRQVEAINKTKDFKVKTVSNDYFVNKNSVVDHGIELKGFYKNGKLRKMEHVVGLSAWNIVTQYFFSENGKLIFVYKKKFQTIDENGNLKKPQKISELRSYYQNGALIKTIGNTDDEKVDFLKESRNLINDLK